MKITKTVLNTMLVATALLASHLHAAAPINPETQPLGAIGPIELSTADLTNGAKAYRGWFENGSWQGDLIEYNVSSNGVLTSSIDLTTSSPAQSVGGTNWSAHVQFTANAAGISHWDTGRKIITSKNGSQIPFRWNSLNATQQAAIDLTAADNGATTSIILNHLRGDRSQEKPVGALRQRFTVLGDIIHSNPEYAAAPEGDFVETSYVDFKNANLARAPRVYVGANDGMLHAFDATNGNEVWAYIPSMLIPKLSRLVGVPYSHTYFVDGGITVTDAFYDGAWHTVLIGSLGAGGKGLYALDVTDPNMDSELSTTKLLGELTADDATYGADIGYIFDATTVTKLNDGNWYAIAGNGISSVNGIAKLVLVNLGSGAVTTISTASGSAGSPNGLAAPALVDTNNDGKADIAFAGDIDGDMWKFDLTGATAGSWKVDYKLYDGVNTQPITMAPDIANHPRFGFLVLFGTGKLYESADITDAAVQSIYGIWDTGTSPAGTEKRLAQLLSDDTAYFGGGFTENVRTFKTVVELDYNTYEGWKVDLPAGERLMTPPQLRAGRLKSTITDPNGLENWFLEVSFDEGGVADESIFDLNRDGVLNTADRVTGNPDADLNDPEDIPMGWQRPTGTMSQVTIASLGAGVDTLFLNFLNPPLVEPPCSGSCDGGLVGGHLDVDTDSKFLGGGNGGGTDGHVHEYDDKIDRTYIDYFDIFPPGGSKLRNVYEVGIPETEEFIVLIANASWSPGGTIIINNVSYNVVEYQRMLHKALAKWDGQPNTLKDPNDNSLIFTLAGLRDTGVENGRGLSINFDSLAIISGGLLPNNTGCVNMTDSIINGRWRGGALIMQLVKASHFNGLGTESALDRLNVQTPSDMVAEVVLPNGKSVVLMEDVFPETPDNKIEGSSPAYEIYGGTHVRDDPEFLYEGSVFWHWASTECYGDDGYLDAYMLATRGVTEAVYQDMLDAAGFVDFAELAAYVKSLEGCRTVDETKGGCKRAYEKVIELYRMGLIVEYHKDGGGGGSDPGDPDGGGGLSGEPVVIEGGVSEGGLTSGPNFETGRRTWIDILPE